MEENDPDRRGDTFISHEVSRFSGSAQQLCEIIFLIKEKRFRQMIAGSITVDCRNEELDPKSRAFLRISAVFAELGVSIIRARVRPGTQNAEAKGKQIERKPLTKDAVSAMFCGQFLLKTQGGPVIFHPGLPAFSLCLKYPL